MLSPETGSSVSVGISQTFAISWTAPITTTTWRDMQYMDLRLRDEAGQIAAWVRVVEQPGADSFYRLLNASEEIMGEGLPGADQTLLLTNTVSLHLAQSSFSGSGLTAIMTPTLTFGPAAIGTYNVEFRVDSKSGDGEDPNVQEGDVLGTFTILPEGCDVAVADVTMSGPDTGLVDEVLVFTTGLVPVDASIPITYTWTPEPETGQGFPNAAFRFEGAGEYLVSVQVTNCGAFAGATQPVRISSGLEPDLSIGKDGPATNVPNQPFTYTLTLANSGATTATNLLVRDALPVGASHLAGGTLVGNEVQWSLPELAGYGRHITLTFSVSADSDVLNTDASVSADGGHSAQNTTPVPTRIVDAQALLTPIITSTLSYAGGGQSSLLMIPGGSVFADTLVTYVETGVPSSLAGQPFAGRAFQLDAYQDNALVSDLRLYETAHITLTYDLGAVTGLDQDRLTLRYWEDGSWVGEGVACTADTDAQTVHCTLETPLLTQYALVAQPPDTRTIFLPLVLRLARSGDVAAEITAISLAGSQYAVTFQTIGFTPQLPGRHVHFFFNTVPPVEAGVPGAGPWFVYAGPSPFTGYGPADRPSEATQMCILVANEDHTVIQGTGNCYDLP